MVLLLSAVLIGLIAGVIRARFLRHQYISPNIQWFGLVLLAVIPQWLVFSFTPTRAVAPLQAVKISLVASQVLLLVFTWKNKKLPGFWLLGLGLILNLVVISLNGGLMPIRPELAEWLVPGAPAGAWQIGERFGTGKDIVLEVAQTRLWFLSDALRLPDWVNIRIAFSVGDVLIATGAFWLLFSMGGRAGQKKQEQRHDDIYSTSVASSGSK